MYNYYGVSDITIKLLTTINYIIIVNNVLVVYSLYTCNTIKKYILI